MGQTIFSEAEKTSVRELVLREREKALSAREWAFRLRGYGYAVKETEAGAVISSLVKNAEICVLEPSALH